MLKKQLTTLTALITSATCICLLLYWGHNEIIRVEHDSSSSFSKGNKAIFSSLQSVIISEVSRGHFGHDRITRIVEGLYNDLELDYLSLSTKDESIITFGTPPGMDLFKIKETEFLAKDYYYLWNKITPAMCSAALHGSNQRRGGNGRQPSNEYKNKTFQLELGVATNDYLAQISSGKNRIHLTLITGCICIALVTLSFFTAVRSVRLAGKLSNAEEKSLQFSEFELASYGLAHETKHPLGIMRARAQQIHSDTSTSDDIRFYAEDIMQEADVAAARLSEFMNYAKIQLPSLKPCNWNKLSEKLQLVLGPDFDDIGAVLKVEMSEKTILLADHDMLQRVLINLISNSLNASDKGTTTTVSVDYDGDLHSIIVEDNGCGIPDDLLPTIFTPYTTGHEDGHGIGLAIVKKIVSAHNWTIEVNSELGSGTRFTINGIKADGNIQNV